MGTRMMVAVALGLGACASATGSSAGGDDESGPGAPDASGPIDAAVPIDACPDTDADGVCDAADACAGFDDAIDTDADTVADGCDVCAGIDDRIDVNTNMTPDCTELVTRTINLKAVGTNLWRGWHSTTGGHASSNDNTLTGEFTGAIHNSYFVFALTGFTASSIASVTLELQLESYSSSDASETFMVWDVSATSSDVENTATSSTIFSDLQSGASYATSTATAAQLTTILSIPLNAQAVAHATAKLGGDFVVGLHLDTAPGYIRFGHTGSEATPAIARVVIKHLP